MVCPLASRLSIVECDDVRPGCGHLQPRSGAVFCLHKIRAARVCAHRCTYVRIVFRLKESLAVTFRT